MHHYFDKIKPIYSPIYKNRKPNFMKNNDLTLAFYDGKQIKILPINIMFKREIVHDFIYENNNKIDISITYCPFTGTPIIYQGKMTNSGLIYQNNIVLYENNKLMTQIPMNNNIKKWSMIIVPFNKIFNKSTLVLQGENNDDVNYSEKKYIEYMKTNKLVYPIFGNININELQLVKKIVYVLLNKDNTIDIVDNNSTDNNILTETFIIPMYQFAYHIFYKNKKN
jgi:hypothetical protein